VLCNEKYTEVFTQSSWPELYTSELMSDNYFVRYIPLLIHLAVVTIIPLGMVVLSWFIGQHKFNKAKMSAYECGMEPVGNAQDRFSVKFYLVAILFILFDVEAVFMYPWAIIFRELKLFGFWEMLVYVAIVLAGFFYIWKKGVLDWNKPLRGERI
jgi:NADH-quinone oxidoreductase subunit A